MRSLKNSLAYLALVLALIVGSIYESAAAVPEEASSQLEQIGSP